MAGTRKPLRGGKQRSKWPPEDSTAPDDLGENPVISPAHTARPTQSRTQPPNSSSEEDIATSQPPVSPWARVSLEMIVMPFVWESLGKRWPELRLGELAQLGEENIKEELSVELVKQLLFLTRAMFGETERQKREIAELQRFKATKEATQQTTQPATATQPTTQTTIQPDTPPAPQPITQSTTQSTTPPGTPPITQSTIQLVTQPAIQSESWQIGKERLGVIQCYQCFSFGHIASHCSTQQVCGFYGLSGHTGSFCPSKEEKKPPKCINCSGCHQAWAAKCPNRPQPQQQPQLQKQPQPYSQQRSKLQSQQQI
ncbi:hypothetical protein B0T25DRAFT_548200 [Lasiosphaeria hispida]|uniref:CCHC-type domain-containing protein n=1 Tax=Lasiosphaeria hispida TaxID=260671 RepID=A0AAJ0HET8_9PEZI|nr:hypothetical protein B0T25DRAFT_548200 [Lasiosphaeria hispida]